MSGRVLIVVHQAHSTPGRIGEMLAERGCELDRRCPCLGDPLPGDLSAYAASIVFGGPQSANDDHDAGIRAELDWIERSALPAGRPLLGICLGAQELARVLGARVGAHDAGLAEIGYAEVEPTPQGRDFLARPTMFYQWHRETFEIPAGAVHLARNDAFPGQAFRYGRHAWAIEFHPEMTRAMIDRWCTSERGRARLERYDGQPHADQIAAFERHRGATDRWLAAFLDGCVLGAPPAAARAGARAR